MAAAITGDHLFEIASPDPRRRGRVVAASSLRDLVPHEKPVYRSYFAFPPDTLESTSTNRSPINGYRGPVHLPEIILDVDTGVLDSVQALALKLMKAMDVAGDYIRPHFSGTGFHIHLPAGLLGLEASPNLPFKARKTLTAEFPGIDPKPLHTKGLIRLTNSLNTKSGLYKIPLTLDELFDLSIKEIKALAEKPRTVDYEPWSEVNPIWANLVTSEEPKRHEDREGGEDMITAGLPSPVVRAGKTYIQGVGEGSRHDSVQAIASVWRLQGIPRQAVLHALLGMRPRLNQGASHPISEKEIERAVNDVYDAPRTFGMKHPAMRSMAGGNEDYLDIASAKDMAQEYAEYVQKRDRAINLQDYYPISSEFWVQPGELMTLLGSTGMGKSTFMQNLLVLTGHLNCLHLSLENSRRLTYRRNLQIAHGWSKEKVDEAILEGREDELNEPIQHIAVKETSMELKRLPQLVSALQPQVLFVDTVDKLKVGRLTDVVQKIYEAYPRLKDMAKELDIIVMAVSHVNRQSARGGIDIHSGLGGGAVEQNSDVVMTISGDRSNPMREIKTVKARDQNPFTLRFKFDYQKSFRFKPIAIGSATAPVKGMSGGGSLTKPKRLSTAH